MCRPPRRSRPARPACEPLEGRALLATSILDPTFGAGGVVLGAGDLGLSSRDATAIDANGRLVTAGVAGTATAQASGVFAFPTLVVRRYNVDGSVDASFGTDGVASVPLPSSADGFLDGPRNIAFRADGSIVLAAPLAAPFATAPAGAISYFEGLVAQLTGSGQLDPAFGSGGESVLPQTAGTASSVAIDAQGRVITVGQRNMLQAPGNILRQALVTRLTAAGAPDPTFAEPDGLYLGDADSPESGNFAVTIAPDGRPVVMANWQLPFGGRGFPRQEATVARLGVDGGLDPTFGFGGQQNVDLTQSLALSGIAVQPDGKVVLAGNGLATIGASTPLAGAFLERLMPDGSVDPSFAGLTGSYGPGDAHAGDVLNSVAVGPDGSIVAAGAAQGGEGLVIRLRADGAPDPSFGRSGRYTIASAGQNVRIDQVAEDEAGRVVVAGSVDASGAGLPPRPRALVARLLPAVSRATPGDYDGDNRSDLAIQFAGAGVFAYLSSATGGGFQFPFGAAGNGATVPAPGDYDGDGVTDVAAYLPANGTLIYRSSATGVAYQFAFGSAGAGASIPAPGDYDGDGITDVAVYLPAAGTLAVRPSSGAPSYYVPFGSAGAGASVPAPGDYDGDGKTDLAVYLPAAGTLAVRPSGTTPAYYVPFGSAGPQASIPAPGDYDGDGKTDVAVFLPAAGAFAIRPSGTTPAYYVAFGIPGVGNTVPAPGDYDGDGITDVAASLPTLGLYAYRGSADGGDVVRGFGTAGNGQSIPYASIPYAQPTGVAAADFRAGPAGDLLPLTDDVLDAIAGRAKPNRRP